MLIFLEGLPGAGKSTNSGILYRQFESEGKPVRWIHEMLRQHPVLFFDEACLTMKEYDQWCEKYDAGKVMDKIAQRYEATMGIDLLEVDWHYQTQFSEAEIQELKEKDAWNFSLERYIEVALSKWRHFAQEAAMHPDKVYILDSCIFQYQIFSFQLLEAPIEALFGFIQNLWDIVKDLNPHLVYLYRESIEDHFEHLRKVRGDEFFQFIWERDRHNPYYQNRPYGIEAYYQFLRDYDQSVRELFDAAPCPKLSIEVSEGQWGKYEAELLKFFHIDFQTEPDFTFPIGTFRNHELELTIKIEKHHGCYHLVDPNGVHRRLYARSITEWNIQDYPVKLLLKNNDQIIIGGENLTNRWTESGLMFERIMD